MSRGPRFYDCRKCPAYCCSYDQVEATPSDIERLARHFGIEPERARERFTKPSEDGKFQVLRHQKDEIFGSVCRFLDLETRSCTIYDARPRICRSYPGAVRCGFYDFLAAERSSQDDPEYVPDFRRG